MGKLDRSASTTDSAAKEKTSVRMGSLPKREQRTDLPEWINGDELTNHHPFTIYGATSRMFRGQEKIDFAVAFKTGGEVQKRVLTLSSNEERKSLLTTVKHTPVTNCRIIKMPIGDMGYWKIIDVDESVSAYIASASSDNLPALTDDDIPF